MGIFSGGFGTGLATGLATSVSKSLTDAMDRREEELSKARVFWQTRQAQKQDQVDAENKRIKSAYETITSEMGGDAAKGLAAYQAIGGNINDVEGYLTELKLTKATQSNYSLQDKLDFDKLNLGDYGDFTFDKGFESIKSELTAPDINYVEAPSLLTAIGLGQDSDKVGKSLQQQVEQLIPTSERTDAGIGAATVTGDLYEGTYTREKAIREQEAKTFQQSILRATAELKELEEGTLEHTKKLEELNSIYDAVGRYNAQSSKVDPNKATVANLGNSFNRLLKDTDAMISYDSGNAVYNSKTYGKTPKINPKTGEVELESAETLRNSMHMDAAKDFVIQNIDFDDEGNVTHTPDSVQGTFLKQNPLARKAAEEVSEEIRQANQKTDDKGEDPPVFTLVDAEKKIDELDISNMSPDEIESKKADIRFNLTRGVETPADFTKLSAKLEELFITKGLSKAPEKNEAPGSPPESKVSDVDKAKALANEMLNDPQKFLTGLIENKGRVLTDDEEETLRSKLRELYLESNPTASQMASARFASDVFKKHKASDQYTTQLQNEYDSLTGTEQVSQWKKYKKQGVDTYPLGSTQQQIAAREKKRREAKAKRDAEQNGTSD